MYITGIMLNHVDVVVFMVTPIFYPIFGCYICISFLLQSDKTMSILDVEWHACP